MKHIDEVISFLFENIADSRITLSKKMKYGYRHYYLCLDADFASKDNHIHINHVTLNLYSLSSGPLILSF